MVCVSQAFGRKRYVEVVRHASPTPDIPKEGEFFSFFKPKTWK